MRLPVRGVWVLKIGHVHSMSMFTAPRLRYTNTSLPSLVGGSWVVISGGISPLI